MIRRLIHEPLVHFAVLAALMFLAYAVLSPAGKAAPAEAIVVSRPKIEQIAALFEQTWQRPPSQDELKALIDDHVIEEIYVREALALELDRDDTVIRRRLRQKMEFLTEVDVDALSPTDAELADYLAAHPERFAKEAAVAFEQVFLNPDRHGDGLEGDANALLAALRSDPAADPVLLGDGSLLPAEMPLTRLQGIERAFGPEVAEAVADAEPGSWTGPVASSYGLHLIRVTAREPGRAPDLAEAREEVLQEWTHDKRQELAAARIAALLKRYPVTIDTAPAPDTAP